MITTIYLTFFLKLWKQSFYLKDMMQMLESNSCIQLFQRQVMPAFDVNLKVSLDLERAGTHWTRIVRSRFSVLFSEVGFGISQV